MNLKTLTLLRWIILLFINSILLIVGYFELKLGIINNQYLVLLILLFSMAFFGVEKTRNRALIYEIKEKVFGKKNRLNIHSTMYLSISIIFFLMAACDYFEKGNIGFKFSISICMLTIGLLQMDCYYLRIDKKEFTKEELISIKKHEIISIEILDDKVILKGKKKLFEIYFSNVGIENREKIIEELDRIKNNMA